ncbi:MAG: glycoside hydrolase family 97 protein [Prolixibacteraceae bacterium]|jgi:alpha-glucosidase|nr:glycoside hydrolase family 97 protein [Prolixibacteraceae bacterium]
MKRIYTSLLLALIMQVAHAETFELRSPNNEIKVSISTDDGLSWSVNYLNESILAPSKLELMVKNHSYSFSKCSAKETSIDEKIVPVYGKESILFNQCNELELNSNQGICIQFRAYNNGVSYRFISNFDDALVIENELSQWNVANFNNCWFAPVENYQQPFEGIYRNLEVAEINKEEMSITPVLFQDETKPSVLITEANMESYPGMFLKKTELGFEADFAEKASKESLQLLGKISPVKLPYFTKMMVRKRSNFIAEVQGTRTFPWRVMLIEKEERNLMNNSLVQCLADSCRVKKTSWIKPGKVVWDWYHSWDIPGVDFKSGVNEKTYKYYIDFAASNGFEYINIDFSWSPLLKLDKPKSKVNLPEVIQYATDKNVGVFIWVVWQELNRDMDRYLELFEAWGVKGLKVDFMDRDDQDVVDFYYELAEKAAQHKLMINFHGAYKADGLSIVYPNVINREGVCGLEQNKFSSTASAQHNLILPFTRNAVGMMDYTPGAMRYTTPEEYKKNWGKPAAMTTRCHQLAMYVVYYGPLQMIADAPTLYSDDALKFLRLVPTTWDATVPLAAKTGEYAVVARKSGKEWFIGAMAGNEAQSIEVDLGFLEAGKTYLLKAWNDGEELAATLLSTKTVNNSTQLEIKLNRTGGAVYHLVEE